MKKWLFTAFVLIITLSMLSTSAVQMVEAAKQFFSSLVTMHYDDGRNWLLFDCHNYVPLFCDYFL